MAASFVELFQIFAVFLIGVIIGRLLMAIEIAALKSISGAKKKNVKKKG